MSETTKLLAYYGRMIDGQTAELATLRTDRDELRRVLERCLMYGQLPIAIADEARKLLEARP